MEPQIRLRREGQRDLPLLLWVLPAPMRSIASAPHGGGLGLSRWVINAQVPASYGRRDPDTHLHQLASSLGLPSAGVGLLTAANVRARTEGAGDGVEVHATVGLGHPIQAAAPPEARPTSLVGTINVVAILAERLPDTAMVDAVVAVTEAKAAALEAAGISGTGTATDAVCILCPADGPFVRSGRGRARATVALAAATHQAVLAGARR
jgi:adenosylcobinamide amidohydrolase